MGMMLAGCMCMVGRHGNAGSDAIRGGRRAVCSYIGGWMNLWWG